MSQTIIVIVAGICCRMTSSAAATTAAEPPDEPPGTSFSFSGFSTLPYAEFSLEEPIANSSQLQRPIIMASSASKRSTTVALKSDSNPSRILEDAETLDAAMVYGQKPFIEHQLDKTVVNVENSIISAGSTALEVLQRSPGIMVDKDGNITMKGKPGVTIMIDGKPTYLSMQDINNMLKSMPADQLEKIELITNPGADMSPEGSGGVINLVSRRARPNTRSGSVRTSTDARALATAFASDAARWRGV